MKGGGTRNRQNKLPPLTPTLSPRAGRGGSGVALEERELRVGP
jgi:hypothetical protein